MQGMILPGDGNGEHSLPGPGMPFRGWTEGRPRDSAGERLRGSSGSFVRQASRFLIRSLIPTTLGILLWPSIGRCAYVQKPGRTGVSWLRGCGGRDDRSSLLIVRCVSGAYPGVVRRNHRSGQSVGV